MQIKNPGEYLKDLRGEKGISFDDASKETKISPSVLRALEDGRLDNIDPIYLKGFLKLYCRFLGLDWENFQKEYSPFLNRKQGPRYEPVKQFNYLSKGQSDKPKDSYKSPVGRQDSVFKDRLDNFLKIILEHKLLLTRVLYIIIAFILIVLLSRGCSFVIGKIAQGRKAKAVQKAAPADIESASNKAPQAQLKQPKETQQEQPVSLSIRAKEDCLIKVEVDGRVVYQRVMRKGKAETWVANDIIEVSVGNASAIELEANGQPVSPLGKRAQAVKNMVITKEGVRTF